MYCIEQTQNMRHSRFGGTLSQCGMENKRLVLEIRSVLDGRGKGSRALEQRSRWLKFADLALRNQGLAPNAQDLDELADLSRAEQEHIKGRIDSSVKNYQRLKGKGKAKTLRKAA